MKRKIVILADKNLGPVTSKMANGIIRFDPNHVCAVIDSSKAGKTVQEVLGYGGDIPIYATLDCGNHNPSFLLAAIVF